VSLSQGLEDGGLAISVGDLSSSDSQLGSLDWDDILVSILGNVGELLTSGITLLSLAVLLGEDNELSLEFLDSVNVGSKSLLVLVSASLVNSDTDSASELGWDTSLLQLSRSETATLANLEVVSLSWRNNDWSEETGDWSWENSSSLSLTSQSSGLMTSWLVEPGSNISVMLRIDRNIKQISLTYVLLIVSVWQHVVSNRHCR
jgi:hypothetical protein